MAQHPGCHLSLWFPIPAWLWDEQEEEGGGSMMWECGVPLISATGVPTIVATGHDLTPRLVATPLAQRVTSLAGPAPGVGHRSS